ncbi:MAG: hypothetical protein EZS28_016172 [Streblomastix strix]|uniref:Serine/threonine specific protein phosphatases domain-containing protein n=1 Tax=Streblomastix strix TaxID=222440 RepID=A0A5J4W1I3_9EUKA|nr:MAG: hypothetical protein EZS28_016172 [Streblomastix strix]
MHGGINPAIPIFSPEHEQIQYLNNSNQKLNKRQKQQQFWSLWGDPKIYENLNLGRPPFKVDTTERFTRANAYDMVMRAHEAATLGFHPALHNGKIMTVFSSDTYMNDYSLGAVTLVRLSVPSKFAVQNQIPQTVPEEIYTTPYTENQQIQAEIEDEQDDEIEETLPPEATYNFLPQTPLLSISVIQLESEYYTRENEPLSAEQADEEEFQRMERIKKIVLNKFN